MFDAANREKQRQVGQRKKCVSGQTSGSGSFRISDGISVVDGVIPSTSSGQALRVAVLQAERRISRYDTVYATGDPSARW